MDTILYEVCARLGDKEREILALVFKHERSEQSKVCRLYNLACEGKYTTDIQLSTHLYGGSKVESKYSHLKTELLFEILRVLIFSVTHQSMKKTGNLYNRIHFSVYHLATEVLFFRKEIKISYEIFDLLQKKAIREGLSEEYEYLLGIKSNLFSNSIDSVSKNALFQNLESLARQKFDRSYALTKLKELTDLIERGLFFSIELSQLKEYDFDTSEDSLIVIYKLRYNVLYFYAIGDFHASYRSTVLLSDYIEQNSKSISDAGGIHLLFAKHYALQFEFSSAVQSYKQSRSHFFPKGSNDKNALLGLARMYLYLDQDELSKQCIEYLGTFELLKEDDREQIELYKALVDFRCYTYQSALIRIQALTYLYQFKESWRIAIKLFELYMLFDLVLLDIFESKLDAFRKMLYTLRGKVSNRFYIIYKILYYIIHNLNKPKLEKGIERRMSSLLSLKKHNKWNPISFEILSFEEWVGKRFSLGDIISKENLQLYNPSDNPEQSSDEN